MQICYLTPYPPLPPYHGGILRSTALLKELMKKHTVHLITFVRSRDDEKTIKQHFPQLASVTCLVQPQHPFRFSLLFNLLSPYPLHLFRRYLTRKNTALLHQALSSHACDLLYFSSSFFPFYHLPHDTPFVVDNYNIEHALYFQSARGFLLPQRILDGVKMYFLERAMNVRAICSFAVSDNDALFFSKLTRTFIVPNGTSLPKKFHTRRNQRILLLANWGYRPNREALLYFFRSIYPFLATVPVDVVGEGVENLRRHFHLPTHITLHGYVEDLESFLNHNGVLVVPLRTGGGTRLKVLQGLAYGIPVVSTTKGVEGIPVEDGEQVMVEDDPYAFSQAIKELLEHPSFGQKLARSGRDLIKDTYEWGTIGKQMLAILGSLEIKKHPPKRS